MIYQLRSYEHMFFKKTNFFMKSCLTKRQQRVCVNSKSSTWKRIISGFHQGSILDPLLFDIFLNNAFLFFDNSDLSRYADYNTLYRSGNNLEQVKETLGGDFQIVANDFKCRLGHSSTRILK